MNKIMVDGVEVTTNYPGGASGYPYSDGNDKKTMKMILVNFQEREMDVIKRCVKNGYTRVTFYETTTRVRGYHKLLAFAK